MARGQIATLSDPRRKILAVWARQTGLFNDTSSLSRRLAHLGSAVPECVRDYIVVREKGHGNDELMVIVDINQAWKGKDELAFTTLATLVRKALGPYREVDFPTGRKYDPRRIYDENGGSDWKMVKHKTPGIFRDRW